MAGLLTAWVLLPLGEAWATTALVVAAAPAVGVWLHECGHAVAARAVAPHGRRQFVVERGAPCIERDAVAASDERLVAAAGPLAAALPGVAAVVTGVVSGSPAWFAGILLAVHLVDLLPVTGDGRLLWHGPAVAHRVPGGPSAPRATTSAAARAARSTWASSSSPSAVDAKTTS